MPRLRLPRLRLPEMPFLQRREKREEGRSGGAARSGVVVAREVSRDYSHLAGKGESFPFRRPKERPAIIFVGSNKGGAGKSLVSAALVYLAAAHVKTRVVGVDLDMDNASLTRLLVPPKEFEGQIASLARSGARYINTADVLLKEGIERGATLLRFNRTLMGCGGGQVTVNFAVIPALDRMRMYQQLHELKTRAAPQVRDAVEALISWLRGKNAAADQEPAAAARRRGRALAILDGKQKGAAGIDYDPIYKVMKERADFIVLVTVPPHLKYREITAQYKDVTDKLAIVVNRVTPSQEVFRRIKLLIVEASRDEVPVFVVGHMQEVEEAYRNNMPLPVQKLDEGIPLKFAPLAVHLRLIERCDTGCCDKYLDRYNAVVEFYREVVEAYG